MAHAETGLDRFLAAQVGVFGAALRELQDGRKRSHWMWFVLPQLRGLGHSERAWRYGLAGIDEARDYLAHPILGPRLHACIAALLVHAATPARVILGDVDALKLQACLTLFLQAAPDDPALVRALQAFFGGRAHAGTLRLLSA